MSRTITESSDSHPSRFKCHNCLLILDADQMLEENRCPRCLSPAVPMCSRDHCYCPHDVVSGIAYCPDCGAAMCPICGSHDVAQISRITGYLQEVSGWNRGKRQELKDRTRYQVAVPGGEA